MVMCMLERKMVQCTALTQRWIFIQLKIDVINSLFSDLRNLSGITLMNLLSALFMTQLLYVIGVGGVADSELCIALSSALHYIRLCVFAWMLLMTHNMYMQYKTGLHLIPVTDTNIGKKFFRYSLFGWGVPAIILLISIFVQFCDKNGMLLDIHDLKRHHCWFLDETAFIYGLVLPSSTMAGFTFYYLLRSAIFSRYIVGIQPDKKLRDKMKRKRTLQIILFTKMTLVISLCLLLATISKLSSSDGIWIGFHIVQGLQGILIAMLVTCNCQVLKLYSRSIKNKASKHMTSYFGVAGSSMSRSTSLQMLTWDPPPDIV
ncbi:latrophilin-like protein LAT-2 isoform X2 [Anthonomus grandis grandis]|uniref:latrophilin-like protein LAT-2 isoform X2 n=1 Tax=Anthonomus grandis grandis TaxID=2921223 RepID=UPI002165E8B3|nr:latrophilin-like protein LAT-2 isoform X2 [Anthonomus grandis grandis]